MWLLPKSVYAPDTAGLPWDSNELLEMLARSVTWKTKSLRAGILASRIAEGILDSAPIYTDIKTFDPERWRGVDIISGGYPCQPFSVAGKRRGKEDPRHLWPYIRAIVDVIRPKICVFENVRGHVRLGLSEVLGELREIGYRVRAGIFAAAEVGAPHRRERVFIIGILGHSEGDLKWRPGQGSRGEQIKTGRSSSQSLEHTASISEREQNNKTSTEPRQNSRQMPGGGCPELENAVSDRRRGRSDGYGKSSSGEPQAKVEIEGSCSGPTNNGWPSRPGEPQYELEAPRTVDEKLNAGWVEQLMGLETGWTQIIDDPRKHREQRLRACGNGVVPQQAEFAIRTLMEAMEK